MVADINANITKLFDTCSPRLQTV